MDSKKKQQLIDKGNGWVHRDIISVEVYERNGRFVAGVDYGEHYFETDPYKRRDYALCEAKGYLEGIKAQIDGWLEYIENELEKEDNNERL